MNELKQALSEGDGQVSSTRLVMVFVSVVSTLVWAAACVLPQHVQLITPPWEVVGLIVGAMGAKAWQRGREA
jgi:hypothetical protein